MIIEGTIFIHRDRIIKDRLKGEQKNRYLIAVLFVTLYSSHIGDAKLLHNIYVGMIHISLNQ
jgi:hypothetical protein